MQKKSVLSYTLITLIFVCTAHGMYRFKNRTSKVKNPAPKRSSFFTRKIESFMTGKEYTPRTSTPTYVRRQIMPKKNIFVRTFEYFKSGKSFQQQEDLRNKINTTLLTGIVENNWDFNKNTTPQFLAHAQEYLNKPLFDDGKTILEKAFADYLYTDEVTKIIKTSSSSQEVADKLYRLFFPAYGQEYAERELLNQKRNGILAYIDALLNLNAPIGSSNKEKTANLLEKKHAVELFLQASAKKSHYSISIHQAMERESIEQFFQPITARLKQLAKQEKLDFEQIDSEAKARAQEIVATCNLCSISTSASPSIEDL